LTVAGRLAALAAVWTVLALPSVAATPPSEPFAAASDAQGLDAQRLGVIYSLSEPAAAGIAQLYASRRAVPAANVLGIAIPAVNVLSPADFTPLRDQLLLRLPTNVQSLLLVWSKPFAVGCMSVTTAFAAGYRAAFCEPGCGPTQRNPLFDATGWLPADTVGWWPAMLLPSGDAALARSLIERGVAADGSRPAGSLYLVHTADAARNVRAAAYPQAQRALSSQIGVIELNTPLTEGITNALGYFTGASVVEELPRVHFRPGGVADHLTSTGGVLYGGQQMSALAWLQQGATAAYGTVSEPCSHVEKFPDPRVLFEHYLHGETVLESYWKSVQMPGQGLFIGEPLARPFAQRRR
jgi:uncharacterized protein (TIGR03790 family)